MKLKLFPLVVFACVSLSLFGCDVDSGPQSTVRKFYQYMESQEIDKVLSLFSESADVSKEKLKLALELAMEEIKESGSSIRSIKFGEEKITGDTAQVTCTVTFDNGETSTDTFDLVRENGNWKLNASK